MKPVSGGRPPRDNRARAAMAVVVGALVQLIARVLIFVVAINLNVKNVADVIIM